MKGRVLVGSAVLLAGAWFAVADAAPGRRLFGSLPRPGQPSGKVSGPVPDRPPVVPGTGTLVKNVVDNFEDESWKWHYNHPKSSEEQDKRMRGPLGKSGNGR